MIFTKENQYLLTKQLSIKYTILYRYFYPYWYQWSCNSIQTISFHTFFMVSIALYNHQQLYSQLFFQILFHFCLFKANFFFTFLLNYLNLQTFLLFYQHLFFLMLLERCYKKGLYKAVSKHCRAFNLINSQFSIFYHSAYIVVYHVNVFCSILALEIFSQSKTCFIIAEYFYFFDCIL